VARPKAETDEGARQTSGFPPLTPPLRGTPLPQGERGKRSPKRGQGFTFRKLFGSTSLSTPRHTSLTRSSRSGVAVGIVPERSLELPPLISNVLFGWLQAGFHSFAYRLAHLSLPRFAALVPLAVIFYLA
jgi:hypothetical protein